MLTYQRVIYIYIHTWYGFQEKVLYNIIIALGPCPIYQYQGFWKLGTPKPSVPRLRFVSFACYIVSPSIYLSIYLIQSNPIHSHLICGMEGVWIWMSWLKIRNRTTTCSCVAKVCRHYDHCGIWRQGMAPGALTVTNRTRGVLTKWEPTVMALYQL